MKLGKFIGMAATALALSLALCGCGDKKSKSDSESGSSSNQAQGKFSPLVTKDAVFALGVNLDKRQAFKVVDAYIDRFCDLFVRGEKTAMVKASAAKYKKDIFADAPLQLRDFLDETGLCDTKLRWAVVSLESLKMTDYGPQLHGLSVAIAGNVSLEKLIPKDVIIRTIQERTIQESWSGEISKKSSRTIEKSYTSTIKVTNDVVFTEMSLEGEKVWYIYEANDPIESRGKTIVSGNSGIYRELQKFVHGLGKGGVDLHVTSLDGQLLLAASSRGALARQIRLYRQGKENGDALGGFSAKEGELLHLKVDGVGERILNIGGRKGIRKVAQLLSDEERIVMGLGALEGDVKVSSDGTLQTSVSLKAASEEDADTVRTLAKVGLMNVGSELDKDPHKPKELVKMWKAVKIGGADGEIKVQSVDPIFFLFTKMYFGRGVGKKVAGATEAISDEEGSKAKSAVDEMDQNTIKKLGE